MDDLRRWLAARLDPPNRETSSRANRTAGRVFALVADACGVGTVVVGALLYFLGESWTPRILASGLVLLTVTFIGLNFDLQRRYSREARRARANIKLAECHVHLTSAVVAIGRRDSGAFGGDMLAATRAFAEALEVATGYACRVAVMDLAIPPEGVLEGQVHVVARNAQSNREDNLPDSALVKENTDYRLLMEGQEYFFSNDLMKEQGYKNSHFGYPMPKEYPYRSTIVWPIKGPHANPSNRRPQIIGFLGVDSKSPRVFDLALDVPTGSAVASAMYASLSLYSADREAEGGTVARTSGDEA